MKVNCRRLPSGKEQKLGIVGDGYTIMQNAAAFEWFNDFVEKGEAFYHTAGSLKGGRIVWVLAELNRQRAQITENDAIRKFLLLTHSHDSSKAIQVGFTPIRVVCWNTLSMATVNDDSDDEKKIKNEMVKLRHTRHCLAGLSAVRETINAADAKFEATAEQYRRLTRFAISKTDLKRYMTLCLSKASPTANPDKPSTRMVHNVEGIVGGESNGSNPPLIDRMRGGYDGTLWGAYNLVSEYWTWESGLEMKTRAQETDNRLTSLWLGTINKVNAFALQEALKLAI
jgi:phage/plasmid-like protein (TIGR03299 family)